MAQTPVTTTTTRDLADNWPYRFQDVEQGDPLYEYLGVYATEISRLDAFIDTLYEQRFIQTATTRELEKLAAAINVTRNEDESDEEFRYRVQLRRVQATSDGTAGDIAEVLIAAFGPAAEQIEISPSPTNPILRLTIPQQLLTDSPLSQATLQTIFDEAMPCGTSVTLITEDVFTFVAPEDEPPEYAAGFGEGAWTT